jgi:chromosome segregation ATPase
VEELDAMIQNLQTNLEATQTAAEEAIGVWESRCQELQVKLESSAVSPPEIETEKSARKAAEERLSSLQKKLEETEEKFSSFRESALSEQARAHSSGDAQRLLERERVEGLEREFEEIRGSRAVLEEERDRLQLLVSELEHELGQTNDALQFHITNEVSEQATRIAAEALRHQIDEMRAQADMDHSDFRAEQIARLAAEKEVTRLRGDLAALLGMEDNEENLSEIQRRTIDATEHFQRKERAEIEELKNALSRAVDELEDSRAAIHEYEERAGKADLQTSMVEQELVTAKTDLLFLSRTIEEMRDAESSRRVALENRIASLEMDHEVLRKFHAAEVENIRNEINQVTMEKDQLAQCLRESEKNRDALVQASSRGQTQDGEVSLEMEVRLLRMERAQLLEAAAEEASRGERRLREARAAEKSSKEADVFVEKELRLAAEMALKNAEKELEVLRAEVGRATANRARSNSTALGELTNTIDELRGRVHLLADENSELRTQLQEIKSEAASTIAQLTDECRHARSRTSQLEREGRYEAEVRAEVARLQASDASKENPAFFGGDDDAARQLSHYNGHQHHHPGATAEQIARLYDVVEEQKQTMMEERLVHAEINKDFEDCLAILAQRALELQSLREALTQAAGEEAVDAAIRVAEERSVEQHGSFVRENE